MLAIVAVGKLKERKKENEIDREKKETEKRKSHRKVIASKGSRVIDNRAHGSLFLSFCFSCNKEFNLRDPCWPALFFLSRF